MGTPLVRLPSYFLPQAYPTTKFWKPWHVAWQTNAIKAYTLVSILPAIKHEASDLCTFCFSFSCEDALWSLSHYLPFLSNVPLEFLIHFVTLTHLPCWKVTSQSAVPHYSFQSLSPQLLTEAHNQNAKTNKLRLWMKCAKTPAAGGAQHN